MSDELLYMSVDMEKRETKGNGWEAHLLKNGYVYIQREVDKLDWKLVEGENWVNQ